ncbi:MAG: tyrosine-type recombinase/integrase [Halothiobacillus sp.]|jgi:integrase|nr:tyrosine-type recombinase/integrase [Halothiobacillus sp.]
MDTHNPKNERIKRQYFAYLSEAKRQSEASVDAVAAALARFEAYNRYRDFKAFHHQQAVAFKHHLAGQNSQATGESLSKATQYATLSHLKRFFQWLAGQPGYKSTVQYSDADYFNLPQKDARIATARRQRPVPTLEQVSHVVRQMPANTDIEKRDRALIAFVMLTGARDSAVASLRLKHIDLGAGCVHQDARDVRTKFSKTFTTFFFPVGDDIQRIAADWVTYLRTVKLWGNDDPLFPRTKVVLGATGQFESGGLQRKHWSNATPIRRVFREAFAAVGLPYFNPHSLRSTLVGLGQKLCQTPEAFKAWSQNLGHEGVLTTFYSYGSVAMQRQGEIIKGMAKPQLGEQADVATAEVMQELLRKLHPEVLRLLRPTTDGNDEGSNQ